jgi:hypothetical protein
VLSLPAAPDLAKVRRGAGNVLTYYRRPCSEVMALWELEQPEAKRD